MRKDENGIWLSDKGTPMNWWNPYEGDIIAPFINFLGDVRSWPRYQKWIFEDGTILYVDFDSYGDSDNDLELDDPNYEEFHEFYFTVLKVKNKAKDRKCKKGLSYYTNYSDFPISWEKLSDKEVEKLKIEKEDKEKKRISCSSFIKTEK